MAGKEFRQRPMTVMIDGRALMSTDFGARLEGAPPEVRVLRVALPPPTELLPAQRSLRSETAVLSEARAAQHDLGWVARSAAKQLAVQAFEAAAALWEKGSAAVRALNREPALLDGDELLKPAALPPATETRHTLDRTEVKTMIIQRLALSAPRAQRIRRRWIALVRRALARAAAGLERMRAELINTQIPEAREYKLSLDSVMHARPNATAPEVVRLSAGQSLSIFVEHETRMGWILARGPEGHVGFIPVGHLARP